MGNLDSLNFVGNIKIKIYQYSDGRISLLTDPGQSLYLNIENDPSKPVLIGEVELPASQAQEILFNPTKYEFKDGKFVLKI